MVVVVVVLIYMYAEV